MSVSDDIYRLKQKFSKHTEDVDGMRVHYAKIGKGPQILCVHGWTNNWSGWVWTAEELSRDHEVIMVDMLGFGDSDNLENHTIDSQADYLAKFIEKSRFDLAGVVGLSMGSQVTSVLGKKYPHLMKSVVLFGPVFVTGRMDRARNKAMEWFMRAVKRTRVTTGLTKRVVQTRRFSHFTAKHLYTYNFDEAVVDLGMEGRTKMRAKTFVDMGVSLANFNIADVLDNYQVPALLAFGDHDIVTSEEKARLMLSGRRGSYHFVVVPESGHIVPAERPGEAARAVREFLTNLD